MNKISSERRVQILHLLVEGNSLRSTARIAEVSRNTVDRLLHEIGGACLRFQDEVMRNLTCRCVQCDDIWSFVGMKQKNAPKDDKGAFDFGDIYTWTAIDVDTKLVPCWYVGSRDAEAAREFIRDLASRLNRHTQLTMDGHKAYVEIGEDAFSACVNYAMLIKLYGNATGCEDETQNPTIRMNIRRFTLLTNAFRKKLENHMHAISLHFMHYNFGRIHKALDVTPAIEAGIADHVWKMEEILALIPDKEPN
jgi:hypothetical protein